MIFQKFNHCYLFFFGTIELYLTPFLITENHFEINQFNSFVRHSRKNHIYLVGLYSKKELVGNN